MTSLGVEWGCKYVLEGPDGTRAVFNDDTDEDFVGILSPESSGLDSAEVREDSQDATEEDGGHHGDFFEGRRPVVLQGTIIASSATQRNERVGKLKRATRALRRDATLTWKIAGGVEVELALRRQQPLRVTKGYTKDFQVGMVAADIFPRGTVTHAQKTGILSTGRKSGATAESIKEILGEEWPNWTSPINALSSDNTYATVELSKEVAGSVRSNELRITNFGFNSALPADAVITGIRAFYEVKKLSGTVEILYDYPVISGANHNPAFGAYAFAGSDVTKEFGGPTNLFKTALTRAQAIASNFGLSLCVTGTKNAKAAVDSMALELFYTSVESTLFTNAGDAPAYPMIKIYGPGSTFKLENATTEEFILLEGVELEEGEYFEIDFKAHTIKKNGTEYAYNAFQFATSNWWALEPGKNEIVITGGTAEVEWQDTYI